MADSNSTYSVYYDARVADAANPQNIPSEDPRARVRASPPEISCNDCAPQLAEYYIVTLSGLEDEWDEFNGAHTVYYNPGLGNPCMWGNDGATAPFDGDPSLQLIWDTAGSFWYVRMQASLILNTIIWRLASTDECTPEANYGEYYSCDDDAPFTCPPSDPASAASCVVSPSAYSGPWTAWGPTNSETGEAIDPWPSLRQAVTDLADGDKEFTLSWSIMNYGTNVEYAHAGGHTETNVVLFVTPPGTTPEIRSEIQAAFTEWKELLESVFSPPAYGGQLTVIFDNNLPGQIQGVEGPGGVNVASSPHVNYYLDTEMPGIHAFAKAAGVGDIRIGVVDIYADTNSRAATVTTGDSNISRAGHRGEGGADIYFSSTYPFRVEGLTEEARMDPYLNFSIKLVAAHEIGHSLGISGNPHDIGRSVPDNFPDPPFPLMTNTRELHSRYYEDFDYFFPHGLKASSWERRSVQEIYGYPPGE